MKERLMLIIERFEGGAWDALGYWTFYAGQARQPDPFFVNTAGDYRGGLFGVIHDDWAQLRPAGRARLPVIDGPTPSPSPQLTALLDEIDRTCVCWIMAPEILAYPWDEPMIRTVSMPASQVELYNATGVLPATSEAVGPTVDVEYEVPPCELWGTEWYKRTIPKLRQCDQDDRITFIFTEEVTL